MCTRASRVLHEMFFLKRTSTKNAEKLKYYFRNTAKIQSMTIIRNSNNLYPIFSKKNTFLSLLFLIQK